MLPLIDVEPIDYIVPILHLLIGIVNKGWTSMGHFLDEFVENVSDAKFELKDELLLLEAEIQDFNDETEILTVNRDMACLEKDSCNEALELYNVSKNSLNSIASTKRKKMDKLRTVKSKLINAKN